MISAATEVPTTITLHDLPTCAQDETATALADMRSPVDFGRPFIPEALTPLAHTRIYRELQTQHRLRYNQLQALFFNEQIVFFETVIGSGIMAALLRQPWPAGFAEQLREFWSDELRHTAMFRDLNRLCAPSLYGASHSHFIRVPAAWTALLRWTTRHPELFPLYLWLMMLQEERSLYYSAQFIRSKHTLEPHFVAVYRAHLVDEARHVRCDQELLDRCWPRAHPSLRKLNAKLFAWMVAEFFSTPKRGQVKVIETLAAEFPELQGRVPELKRQLLGLSADPGYRSSIYSREITPRSFALFDRWSEFRVLERVMPAYRFRAGGAP